VGSALVNGFALVGFELGVRAFAFPAPCLFPVFIEPQPLGYPWHNRVGDKEPRIPLIRLVHTDVDLTIQIGVGQFVFAFGDLQSRAENRNDRPVTVSVRDPYLVGVT